MNSDEKTAKKETPKIYESPDKGKTVYWRYFGEHPSKRRLLEK